jgi:coenzyme F420-0:L-glutamate ligase / coenzyme F420-1:gamma-L-glutamate ligase
LKSSSPQPAPSRIEIIPLRSLPEVRRGHDLAFLVTKAAAREQIRLQSGDVCVLAQKIVSKAEGSLVRLREITPSPLARAWARIRHEDPRFIEVVLRESARVVRMTERALIAETRHGFVCANAGVDRSNIPGKDWVSCLPADPDASARRFVRRLRQLTGISLGAVISDTFGRAWRLGQANVAIGAAGIEVIKDLRGGKDGHGHSLRSTMLAVGDELAAAAGLVMGKIDRVPAVIVRGYSSSRKDGSAWQLVRPPAEDLFR